MAFEFGDDPAIRATWLYYGESRTQAEVAQEMGVSRATVANHLAEARRRGLVSIALAPDLLTRLDSAQALRERYGLAAVHVAPVGGADDDPVALRRTLGRAAAHLLDERIGAETVLGVAWGRTMAELGEAMPQRARPGVSVVQVSGSSLGDERSSPEACTLLIASRLGARGYNFHAPAVVTGRELRDALLREPALLRHFERVLSCDAVVFGVGELTPETRWADGDHLIRPAAPAYLAAGSVGILIGRFIDTIGAEVEGPLSGRQIGMDLADLRAIPERLCVAGGPEKTAAIRAALRGGLVTHLVTDTATASRLLEEET